MKGSATLASQTQAHLCLPADYITRSPCPNRSLYFQRSPVNPCTTKAAGSHFSWLPLPHHGPAPPPSTPGRTPPSIALSEAHEAPGAPGWTGVMCKPIDLSRGLGDILAPELLRDPRSLGGQEQEGKREGPPEGASGQLLAVSPEGSLANVLLGGMGGVPGGQSCRPGLQAGQPLSGPAASQASGPAQGRWGASSRAGLGLAPRKPC